MMEVRVGAGLELEKFFSEAGEVHFKRPVWRRAFGEGLREESKVGLRDNSFFETEW